MTSVAVIKAVWTLMCTLRRNYETGKKANIPYILDVAERGFNRELNIIRNAPLITDLTPKQNVCVHTAVRDIQSAIQKAAVEWLKCTGSTAYHIHPELLATEKLYPTINQRLKTHGVEALMTCISQNTADSAAAVRCCTDVMTNFRSCAFRTFDHINVTCRMYCAPIVKCREDFIDNTKANVDRVITTLKACVPQLPVTETYSEKNTRTVPH